MDHKDAQLNVKTKTLNATFSDQQRRGTKRIGKRKKIALTAPTAAPITPSSSTTTTTAAASTAVGVPVSPRAPGMLHDHALPAKLLPVQLVHGVVGIPVVVKLHESVAAEGNKDIST